MRCWYGGSFSTQGGITNSGTISGAGPLGGTGTVYAEQGTLDLTGTVTSGLTFDIAAYGDLKIDGTATMANSLGLIDYNQTLEIGPSGSLTITTAETDHAGTFKLDGGTLTDAQGFKTGSAITIAGFGTINGTEYGLVYQGPVVEATGGTLTLNGDIYVGNIIPEVAAGATFSLLGAVQKYQLVGAPAGTEQFTFLSSASGTLRLGTAITRQSFETNGTIANMNVSTNGTPTNVLDLADVQPSSITSAMVANGNTVELVQRLDHDRPLRDGQLRRDGSGALGVRRWLRQQHLSERVERLEPPRPESGRLNNDGEAEALPDALYGATVDDFSNVTNIVNSSTNLFAHAHDAHRLRLRPGPVGLHERRKSNRAGELHHRRAG